MEGTFRRPFWTLGGELDVTSTKTSPSVGKIKLPKPKLTDRRELDDAQYRRFIEEYGDGLRDGMIYLFGDHPRED